MATHKSAEKAARQAIKKQTRNAANSSKVKGAVKAVRSAVASNDKAKAQENFKEAQSQLAKAVTKGFLKKNTAARLTKRLSSSVKKISGN